MPTMGENQRDFWQKLIWEMERQSSSLIVGVRNPPMKGTITFGIGTSGFHLWAGLHSTEQRIEVGLLIFGAGSKNRFQGLLRSQRDIETRLGPLRWDKCTQIRYSVMKIESCDPFDRMLWDANCRWITENLERFATTFKPLIPRV